MGTGFSLDPDEFRAAANVIEGYGAMQADHGSALASGTSTPLSSSGTGISGAISNIATGTVQKIVTDVTATTKGFADDTAKGLRTQAATMEQLDTDLAGRSNAILSDAPASLGGGSFAGGGMSALVSSPLSTAGSRGGGFSTTTGSPLTAQETTGGGSAAQPETGTGLDEAEPSTLIASEQGSSEEGSATSAGQMRSGAGAGAGSTEERGQRPDYLKSDTEITDQHGDRTKAAVAAHVEVCGATPIPLDQNRLVCAKCGSIINVDDAQTPALAE